jgi:crotonobetainyl-CoA:carnitine CoA-transferase CaiB-like acyl-CoA transferase
MRSELRDAVPGPLDGVRVIDFSQAMAGPFAAQKLGDLGADVIKVEPTGTGEWHRSSAAGNAWVTKHNSSFLAFNRNKTSLSINLKADASHEIIGRLVEDADVVISNFRPGVAERLRIDYETLAKVNPRIVYASLTGYGETGPYARRPGQDLVIQGYSGAMWNTGQVDDPPLPIGVFVCDATAAHLVVEGVLAALFYRERTGVGQKVLVNMLDGIVDMQIQELSVYLTGGVAPKRSSQPLAHVLLSAPYGIYKTADGYMTVSIGPLPLLGDVLDDDRLRSFTDPADGTTYRDEIYLIVAEKLRARTTEEWLERFMEFDYWAGPVYDYDDLLNDPQVQHNKTFVEIEHPTEGTLTLPGIPIQFTATPGSIRLPAPDVGQHSKEILLSLGYTDADVEALAGEGVIQYVEERASATLDRG